MKSPWTPLDAFLPPARLFVLYAEKLLCAFANDGQRIFLRILQQMENSDGVMIAATNSRKNFDDENWPFAKVNETKNE